MKFPFLKKSKIEVFVRYCYYSSASAHKNRPEGFTHEKCFENLLETLDPKQVNCTFLLDTHFAKPQTHFVQKQTKYPVVEIDAGEEGKSFLALIDHVLAQNFADDTILYFLEDDYLHKENWAQTLLEAFSLPEADYITLFDHRDKYDAPMYEDLEAKLFYTPSTHWRTTPSTTNTYAMLLKTLKEDLATHRKYSEGHRISLDHDKFLDLKSQGRTLISSIPGWSCHCEPAFASPCHDWTSLLNEKALK